uniref:FABP domain-containing protein n=1 Tax=Panagrellus redivivus TaxID=6233 RepID=A0A7E4VY64_PANRE
MRVSVFVSLAVCSIVAVSSVQAADFPAEFLGTWKLGESENFDEYLTAKGYGWITRQVVKLASITKTFEKGTSPGIFTAKIDTSKSDVEWINVPFDKEFEADYIDDSKHKIKFYYKDGTLFEDHKPIGDSESKPELYSYKKDGADKIIMFMTADGVTAKRWYHKQ